MRDFQIWQRKNLRDFFKANNRASERDYWCGLSLHCKQQVADLASKMQNKMRISEIQKSYIAYYGALSRICDKKLNELGGVK